MPDRSELELEIERLKAALRGTTDYLEAVDPLLADHAAEISLNLRLRPIADMLPIWRALLASHPAEPLKHMPA